MTLLFGVGIDLVSSERIRDGIARLGQRFKDRIYTADEQAFCEGKFDPVLSYARLFALKEAASKAIGTGLAIGVGWKDFELARPPGHKPQLQFYNRAAQRIERLTPEGYKPQWDWSISDDPPFATAIVTIYCVPMDAPIGSHGHPLCAAPDDRTEEEKLR